MKKLSKTLLDCVRKESRVCQVASGRRPTTFQDKSKYSRKRKHKENGYGE